MWPSSVSLTVEGKVGQALCTQGSGILGTESQIWPAGKKYYEQRVIYGLQVRNIRNRKSNMACK